VDKVVEAMLKHDMAHADRLWDEYNKMYSPKGVQAKRYFKAGAVSAMTFIRHINSVMPKKEEKKDE